MLMIENLLRPNMKIMIENLLRPMRTKAFSSLVSAASVGETSWMKNLGFVHLSFFVVMMIKIKIIQIIILSWSSPVQGQGLLVDDVLEGKIGVPHVATSVRPVLRAA